MSAVTLNVFMGIKRTFNALELVLILESTRDYEALKLYLGSSARLQTLFHFNIQA